MRHAANVLTDGLHAHEKSHKKNKGKRNSTEAMPEESKVESEDVLLVRALTTAMVPRFTAGDIPLFHAIVQDLFPGLNVGKSNNVD